MIYHDTNHILYSELFIFQYKSVDNSPLSNYVMHPFWNQLVKVCIVFILNCSKTAFNIMGDYFLRLFGYLQ